MKPRGSPVRVPRELTLGIPFRLNFLGVDLTLPRPTPIVFRTCGEPGTRYDPAVTEIVFRYEMFAEIDRLKARLR